MPYFFSFPRSLTPPPSSSSLDPVQQQKMPNAKGPPVMDDAERKAMVESLKWVDEVLTDVPYELTPDFLSELFTRHRIDVVVHGDDPCLLPDGTDAYAHAKAQGRFRVRIVFCCCSLFSFLVLSALEREGEEKIKKRKTQNPLLPFFFPFPFLDISLFYTGHQEDGGRLQHRHRRPHADAHPAREQGRGLSFQQGEKE